MIKKYEQLKLQEILTWPLTVARGNKLKSRKHIRVNIQAKIKIIVKNHYCVTTQTVKRTEATTVVI